MTDKAEANFLPHVHCWPVGMVGMVGLLVDLCWSGPMLIHVNANVISLVLLMRCVGTDWSNWPCFALEMCRYRLE